MNVVNNRGSSASDVLADHFDLGRGEISRGRDKLVERFEHGKLQMKRLQCRLEKTRSIRIFVEHLPVQIRQRLYDCGFDKIVFGFAHLSHQ